MLGILDTDITAQRSFPGQWLPFWAPFDAALTPPAPVGHVTVSRFFLARCNQMPRNLLPVPEPRGSLKAHKMRTFHIRFSCYSRAQFIRILDS